MMEHTADIVAAHRAISRRSIVDGGVGRSEIV